MRLASADPHAKPIVDLHLLDHSEDLAVMMEAVKLGLRLMTTPPLAGIDSVGRCNLRPRAHLDSCAACRSTESAARFLLSELGRGNALVFARHGGGGASELAFYRRVQLALLSDS